MDDERIFGITKLKLQAFSLAALEMSLGDIVVKVTSMMERSSIQIATRVRKVENFPDSKIFVAKTFRIKPVNCIIFQIRDNYA